MNRHRCVRKRARAHVANMHKHLWAHPCYLGASCLNCGWSWLYECQAYPDTGSESCWLVGVDRYPTRYRAEVQRTWEEWWPHLCRDPWLTKDPGDCF